MARKQYCFAYAIKLICILSSLYKHTKKIKAAFEIQLTPPQCKQLYKTGTEHQTTPMVCQLFL